MTDPVLNVALLDEVLEQIEQDQGHWHQAAWREDCDEMPESIHDKKDRRILVVNCGTSFCFGGWAVQLGTEGKGAKWMSEHSLWANKQDRKDLPDSVVIFSRGGCVIGAEDRARRLLGLNEIEADRLFAGSNDLEDLRRVVGNIKAGEYR